MVIKQSFSNKVRDYVKYRPTYPSDAIDYLYDVVKLDEQSTVADIGAGTGKLSELLVGRGTTVIAVEPNLEMRVASEQILGHEPHFHAVEGSAESTGLSNDSVDFIVCAQAFHWFDRSATQLEFKRILKENGKVILVWNTRQTNGTPFLEGLEQLLLNYGMNYAEVNHKNISENELLSFFKENTMEKSVFKIEQLFDFEGLCGRVMSSSYTPMPEHPNYDPLIEQLRKLFNRYEKNGKVTFIYETELFWGEI
ncbi:ubiquinone/menaquinone biosynthesis C-methylase UbiE [Pullulanibacillus pueri]|uniref:Methyltransferase n=1 Tax=Pullulanibacillus pueri TaxID=1437324 RepID=A0A8J2ZTE0_9BACL|nr:class I SAM-dependent methyltransferase [Pullulanibacillus pueri]MBM7681192.1 ubiquinone/menaquinone biosynthesis C-methylase UbiE [Pullulanibacillus pueri]GGH77409.1 methyltransferase [Pullulanibacillus pueri]